MTVQNLKKNLSSLRQGFTLIELLIVMAILGVLAVVVLVAINPVQQLARTRDTGRKAGVAQIGHAAEAFYTARGGVYPAEDGTGCTPASWLGCIVEAGEISVIPAQIDYRSGFTNPGCTGGAAVNQWCYDLHASGNAIVYTGLESDSEISKCDTGEEAYFLWSTADGRGGLTCYAAATDPSAPAAAGSITFVD